MKDFLKNHWTWIITTLVAGIMAWGRVNFTLDATVRTVAKNTQEIAEIHDMLIEQKAVNKMVSEIHDIVIRRNR